VKVRFFFDFLSPYSYLASALLARSPEYGNIALDYRPVVFGSILGKLGTKGPGEIPARRKHGLADLLMLAQHHGIPLIGPPAHPFNSIYALRSVSAVADPVKQAALVHSYFRAAWAEGKSLEDLGVLKQCLNDVGIEQDPEAAATTRESREALKKNLNELLELGGWGVPTFMVEDVMFFGHDRLPLLRAYLDQKTTLDRPLLADMLSRPQPGRIV